MRKIPEASEGRPRICHRNHACDAGSALAFSEKYVKMRIQTVEKGMKNMKRAFALILALALMCAMAFAETAEPEVVHLDPAVEMYVHAIHGLRLRRAMDLEDDTNIIRVLALNEAVLVDAIVDGVWAHVTWELPEAEQTEEATTLEGYVWYEYLGAQARRFTASSADSRTIIVYGAYVLGPDGNPISDGEGGFVTADQEMNKEEYVQYRVMTDAELAASQPDFDETLAAHTQEFSDDFDVLFMKQRWDLDYDPVTRTYTVYFVSDSGYHHSVTIDTYGQGRDENDQEYVGAYEFFPDDDVFYRCYTTHNGSPSFNECDQKITVDVPVLDENGEQVYEDGVPVTEPVQMWKDEYIQYRADELFAEKEQAYDAQVEEFIAHAEAEFDAIYAAQQSGVESSTVDWSTGEPVVVETADEPAAEATPLSGDDAPVTLSTGDASTSEPDSVPDGDAPAPATDQPPMAAADPAPVIDGGTGGISGYVPNPSAE